MRSIFVLLFAIWSLLTFAQEGRFKEWGKVTVEDLKKTAYAVDSNAAAVVLSDIGNAAIVSDISGQFYLQFSRHKVVHILNKNGYGQANYSFGVYSQTNNEDLLYTLKAVTYNLEGGRLAETSLDPSAIYADRKSNNLTNYKFTLPNIKEGSIVEIEYHLKSYYILELDNWRFQDDAPQLWSEFNFSVPQFFYYRVSAFGYHPLYINEKKTTSAYYTVRSSAFPVKSPVINYRWAMKEVPELKEEAFTSTINNHVARLEFQLATQQSPLLPKNYLQSWSEITKKLRESYYFGVELDDRNGWMKEYLRPITAGAVTEREKAEKIFSCLRDNIVCNDHQAVIVNRDFKDIWKTKKGSVSEINVLLVAMLVKAGLRADPVLLSTFHNGYVTDFNPSLDAFDYVVAQVAAEGKTYYLDASQSHLGFGRLLPECYNGLAIVVNQPGDTIQLAADALLESKLTSVLISMNEKGEWEGSLNQEPGYYESYHLRERIAEKGKDDLIKGFTGNFIVPVKVKSLVIDSLSNYNEPVALHYGFKLSPEGEDLFYINPMFGEGYHKNPFNAAERFYPVEMPYPTDETYLLTFQVPEGYEVDELPKNVVAKLDATGKSFFDYRIARNGNVISLRSRIKIAKTFFAPEEYDVLKSFFEMVVSKQTEQMVLKKKR